jgi:nicotinamide-nucleotide amidase
MGMEVLRSGQLPDRYAVVVSALETALERADLVITTGGLGPTPDDLTREAIAGALEQPLEVSAELEAWLRGIWERRGLPFSDTNLKQAWLIPGAEALPNPHGTAPGWWVEHDGSVIVALPGPPRELRPMWNEQVVPRLRARGVGVDQVVEMLHLTGIGESALVDVIGPEPLRADNPRVATYARLDAVDVRVSAVGEGSRSARQLVDQALAELLPRLEPYVYARGEGGWPQALAALLGARRVATVEVGTGGQLTALLGEAAWLAVAQHLPPGSPALGGDETPDPQELASRARAGAGVEIGVAVVAVETGEDMRAEVGLDIEGRTGRATHAIFRGGETGRRRSANAACAELWRRLRI